jgi:PXPV repeat-containing protein
MKARSVKFLSAAALVLGSLGVASAAHARSDVFFSIGVQAPGYYAEPAPVYVQPAPVYVQPRHAYVAPAPVYVTPGDEYRDSDEWRGRQGWSHWQERRHARLRGPYGDFDRDGVPNRFDRFPGNPYRR